MSKRACNSPKPFYRGVSRDAFNFAPSDNFKMKGYQTWDFCFQLNFITIKITKVRWTLVQESEKETLKANVRSMKTWQEKLPKVNLNNMSIWNVGTGKLNHLVDRIVLLRLLTLFCPHNLSESTPNFCQEVWTSFSSVFLLLFWNVLVTPCWTASPILLTVIIKK